MDEKVLIGFLILGFALYQIDRRQREQADYNNEVLQSILDRLDTLLGDDDDERGWPSDYTK